jgi:hypothetical protein
MTDSGTNGAYSAMTTNSRGTGFQGRGVVEFPKLNARIQTIDGSIPTLASSFNCVCSNELGGPEGQWLTVWLTDFGLFQDCVSIREDSPAIA